MCIGKRECEQIRMCGVEEDMWCDEVHIGVGCLWIVCGGLANTS